ncbi:MAG: hypothetical protein ACUVWV_09700 [Thermodesulfobacteriota bacterium]
MNETIKYCGQVFESRENNEIREFIADHRERSRRFISYPSIRDFRNALALLLSQGRHWRIVTL